MGAEGSWASTGLPWILSFVSAAALSAAAAPGVRRLAFALDVVDRPNARSVNQRPDVPLLGGLAVGLGFCAALALAWLLARDPGPFAGHVEGVLLGGVLLLGLGALDDRFGLAPGLKLCGQCAAAALAIAHDFRIDQLTDPVSRSVISLPAWLSWSLTAFWIVGITNALNLMDGLDGCATGVAAIIGATLTLIAWQAGLPAGVAMGVALVGALLGFLPFNFPPGRIFLGDTGALFTGYVLSLLALEGFRGATVLTFVVPMLALAVPILDTGLSIVRRLRGGRHIFAPDRGHMHHRLLESAGSQQSAVLFIYFVTACFCLIAVSFTRVWGTVAILFLGAVVLLTIRMLRNLGFLAVEEPAAPRAGVAASRKGEQS